MIQMRYYPAYLLNAAEYDDAEACLRARGCTAEQIEQFIALARIHQSEIVLRAAESDSEEFFLVIAEDGSKWRVWAARAQMIRDTHEKALALIEKFKSDVEWRVFGIRQYESLRSIN